MATSIIQIPGLTGGPEILIILLIAVLLFGANKIPKLARSTGQAMGEFQKGRQEIEDELQEMKDGPSTESGSTAGSNVSAEEPTAETASGTTAETASGTTAETASEPTTETVSDSSAETETSTESSN